MRLVPAGWQYGRRMRGKGVGGMSDAWSIRLRRGQSSEGDDAERAGSTREASARGSVLVAASSFLLPLLHLTIGCIGNEFYELHELSAISIPILLLRTASRWSIAASCLEQRALQRAAGARGDRGRTAPSRTGGSSSVAADRALFFASHSLVMTDLSSCRCAASYRT